MLAVDGSRQLCQLRTENDEEARHWRNLKPSCCRAKVRLMRMALPQEPCRRHEQIRR